MSSCKCVCVLHGFLWFCCLFRDLRQAPDDPDFVAARHSAHSLPRLGFHLLLNLLASSQAAATTPMSTVPTSAVAWPMFPCCFVA